MLRKLSILNKNSRLVPLFNLVLTPWLGLFLSTYNAILVHDHDRVLGKRHQESFELHSISKSLPCPEDW